MPIKANLDYIASLFMDLKLVHNQNYQHLFSLSVYLAVKLCQLTVQCVCKILPSLLLAAQKELSLCSALQNSLVAILFSRFPLKMTIGYSFKTLAKMANYIIAWQLNQKAARWRLYAYFVDPASAICALWLSPQENLLLPTIA